LTVIFKHFISYSNKHKVIVVNVNNYLNLEVLYIYIYKQCKLNVLKTIFKYLLQIQSSTDFSFRYSIKLQQTNLLYCQTSQLKFSVALFHVVNLDHNKNSFIELICCKKYDHVSDKRIEIK